MGKKKKLSLFLISLSWKNKNKKNNKQKEISERRYDNGKIGGGKTALGGICFKSAL